MKVTEIDWARYEDAIFRVAALCLEIVRDQEHSELVCGFGISAIFEEGLINVGLTMTPIARLV